MTILERVIAAGRPLQVKGKGALLNPLTPRSGSQGSDRRRPLHG